MNRPTGNYQRTFEELEQVASKFWPPELSEIEAQLSLISLLLETQNQFISILSFKPRSLDKFFIVLEAATLPVSVFIKH